jgi:hypothetical protein
VSLEECCEIALLVLPASPWVMSTVKCQEIARTKCFVSHESCRTVAATSTCVDRRGHDMQAYVNNAEVSHIVKEIVT